MRHRETTTKKPPTRTKPPSHPAPAPPVPTGSDIGTSSPCPPPPNAICLTIPYEAHVGEKEIPGLAEPGSTERSSSPSRSCASSLGADPRGANPVFLKVGSIVSRGVCGALGAADTVARALNYAQSIGGDRRRDGRVVFGRSIDASAAKLAGGATFKDSTDYEYDHSLASLCHLRDARVCGGVYGLQAAYNASHVAMTDAAKAAEEAFDAFEKAKEVCDEFSAKADEMGAAMRAGKKICRERARDATGDDLARALGAIKATLLEVDEKTGGGRCSRRAMYEQTKAALAAEIAAENKAGASHRDGKKIGKVVAVERTLEGGKAVKFGRDERSTTFVLPNGYVMPDEYFDECDKLSNSIDAMVAMLKPQTVKEHVCSEYTPGEVATLKADAKRACASIDESKDAYARKLDAAKSLRSEVEARYGDLLDAEAAARGKTRTLDRLIATTAAAGGNDEAARELALSQAEERAAAAAAERAAPAPNSPESIADAAERIERTPAEKIGANDVVDVLRRFAGAKAVVPPRVSKHIDAAVAANAAKRASTRNVADMLEAFAAAKVVPGDKAREAMFAAIVREATRATPKAIAEVLHGLGSARGVGAGLQGADSLTRRVVSKLAAAAAREAPKMDAREIADVLSSFGFAKPNKGLPGDARAALDAAVTREASRMSPEDVASVLVGYHRAGAAPEASGLLQKIAKFSDPSDAVDALAVFASRRVKPAATTREALAKAVVNAAPAMRAGDVVKTLDAFADAGCAPMPPVAGDALGRAVLRLESATSSATSSIPAGAFGPEAIGDALRAFRRAGVAPSNGVKDALARAAAREAPRFTPKNIAGTLEGYADAGESPPWSVVSACVDGVGREAANMDADEIADVVGAFASARVCGKLTATARSALDNAVAREAPRMYARDVASVARAYADCGEGAPGHGSVGPLLKAAAETAATMHPTDARSTLAAVKRMGLSGAMDAKTRRALEAAAAATGEEANALRRSPTARERREARRGGERPGETR